MPDSATTSTETAEGTEQTAPTTEGTDDANTPPEGDGEKPKVFDEAYVKTLRSESAKHRTDLRAKETEVTTLTERLQTYETTVPALEQRAASAESLALRYEIALEKGLPIDLAKRLVGADRDEMAADADALKAALGASAPVPDMGQGARTPTPAPKPGVNDALRAFVKR